MCRKARSIISLLFAFCVLPGAVLAQDLILTLPAATRPAEMTIRNRDLSFAAGVTSADLQLSISVTGGEVRFDRLVITKQFPDGSTATDSDPLSTSVRPGAPRNLTRTLELSPFERARALAGSTQGTFELTVEAVGTDAMGGEVSAITAPLGVAVSQGLPDPIDGLSTSIVLPPDYRYYLHDVIAEGEVRITSPASGTVRGEIVMRGPDGRRIDWSQTPSFTVQVIPGSNTITIPATFASIYPDRLSVVPTDAPGPYSVEVQIDENPAASTSKEYEVVSRRSPLLDVGSIVLIPGLAEARSIQGGAELIPGDGYEDYYFASATCELYVEPLEASLAGAQITGLLVRYFDDDPETPVIMGGSVEKSTDAAPLLAFANDFVRLRSISFDATSRPGAQTLLASARLFLPDLGFEVVSLPDFEIGTDGVVAGEIDWSAAPQQFEAFGLRFGISRLTYGYDAAAAEERYRFGLSGSVEMETAGAGSSTWRTLTSFQGLTFYTDGEIDGRIAVEEEFYLVPDLLKITQVTLEKHDAALRFGLSVALGSLPSPLDKIRGTEFTVWIDADGNAQGTVVAFNELTPGGGHSLDGDADPTEWPFYIAAVDITYASFTFYINGGRFQADHSYISIGSDFYLNLSVADTGAPADADSSRVTLGELVHEADGTRLEGGIVVGMDGSVDIAAPTNLRFGFDVGYTLDLEVFKLTLEHIAFLWRADDDPVLGIEVAGGFAVDMEQVDFGLSATNFVIGLDGSIPEFPSISGFLHIMDTVKVDVRELTYWSDDEPQELTFLEDRTEGSGADRVPAQGEASVLVTRYLNIGESTVEVRTGGDDSEPAMSGGFQRLCFYEDTNGGKNFILSRARIETEGVTLISDFSYTQSMISIGGSIETESFTAAAAGKIGKLPNGKTTMGVFVAASGLRIPIYAGVFLNEVGGGIFIYPTEDDITLVRSLARFERPELELDAKIEEYKPGGAGNPGCFALMFVGGVYFLEENLVYGRSLVTITANFFSLDAEVKALDDLVSGKSYLEISWDPMYADGNSELEASFADMFTINGTTGFYFYGSEAWGISGDMNLEFLGKSVSTASFFLGNPGFLIETEVKIGVDLKVLSGHLTYGGMFWYYRTAGTLGAHALVEAKGEFLEGLFGAKAGLEAALIYADGIILYGVGSFSVTVCWVKVWDGSLWVAVEGRNLDGGEGRNKRYDDMIDEARTMASSIADERDELLDDLRDARLALIKLNPDQLQAAGAALVERSDSLAPHAEGLFESAELDLVWDGGDALPEELEIIYDELFGPEAQSLKERRNELLERIEQIEHQLGEVEALHEQVLERLAEYEAELGDPLPTVEEMGSLSDPFRGYESASVIDRDGNPRTVMTGFVLDEADVESSQDALGVQRRSFADYQQALIERAGMIDARLRDLDAVLYGGEANVTALNQAYADEYERRSAYVDDLVAYYGRNRRYAEDALETITGSMDRRDVRWANDARAYSFTESGDVDWAHLRYLNNVREDLLEYLIVSGGEEPPAGDEPDMNPIVVFNEKGAELWWDIPVSGFTNVLESTWSRRSAAIGNWKELSRDFKENWAAATLRAEALYSRKADLYDILYEIYDQLATYGTGPVPIADDGNAAGFTPVANAGLAFRTAEAADWVGQQQQQQQGLQTLPQAQAAEPPEVSISVGEAGSMTAEPAEVTPVAEIGVGYYFTAKREEIRPYTQVPRITALEGRVTGVDAEQSRLHLSFGASHPVGIVEYSYRIAPASDDGEAVARPGWSATDYAILVTLQADDVATLHDDYSSLYELTGDDALPANALPEELPRLVLYVPWFSLGSRTVVDEPLFLEFEAYRQSVFGGEPPELVTYPVDPPGDYHVYVRARGAGGRSIVRRSALAVDYLNAYSPDETVLSELDSDDETPPSTPVVTVNVSATARSDLLYAEWGASDYESGIQRYEYGVATHEHGPGEQGVAGPMPTGPTQEVLIGGAEPGEVLPDVLGWTDAGGRSAANLRGLELDHGSTYTVAVRATNGAGLASIGISDPILVDLTPPERPVIDSFARTTADGMPNSVQFHFSPGSDPETEVVAHAFALGTEPPSTPDDGAEAGDALDQPLEFAGGVTLSGEDEDEEAFIAADLFPWTEIEDGTAIVVDLPLHGGEDVYLFVRARNAVGLESWSARRLQVEYPDDTPPQAGPVRAWPSGADEIVVAWGSGRDDESGVAAYRFAVSTSPEPADDLLWTEVESEHIPYVLGQGTGAIPLDGPPSVLDLEQIADSQISGAYPAYIVRAVQAAVQRAGGQAASPPPQGGEPDGQAAAGALLAMGAAGQPGAQAGSYPYRYAKSIAAASRVRTFYAFVRTVNGSGLTTTRSWGPFQVFGAAPGGDE